jgi:hypothetical protein
MARMARKDIALPGSAPGVRFPQLCIGLSTENGDNP